MVEHGHMEPYLRWIRFPRFRNLADGLRIDFTFPVTALVGVNGTNKSSVLRALQGCPDYSNIGTFWFSTAVDPIEDATGGNRIRFIHGWNPPTVGTTVEAVKQREPSRDDPDYFEPAKPRIADGMAPMPAGVGQLNEGRGREGRRERSADRWNPIPKEVEYIDFRAELSAFDKYFFHNPYRRRSKDPASLPAQQERSRKQLIRDRSPGLRRSLDWGLTNHRLGGQQRIHTPRTWMPDKQVEAVSEILGRPYSQIALIEHSFFQVRGWTALLHSDHHKYSEAFAGSGEFAAVRVVHRICTAKDGALVLLDEPEVSLHPGAQAKLIEFIIAKAKEKRLQVIFSTHSPHLIEPLPNDAIKVLQLRADDGRVELRSQESLPREAFLVVGHQVQSEVIWTEDRLAAEIVRQALRFNAPELLPLVDIRHHPGGSADIKKTSIATWALAGLENVYVLLDGDENPGPLGPSDEVAGQGLTDHLLRMTKRVKPALARSSGESKEVAQRTYIRWWEKHVRFLPGSQPERLLLKLIGEPFSEAEVPNAKAVWETKTWEITGRVREAEEVGSEDIFQTQARALARVARDDPDLSAIAATVKGWL
jgi:predicted ATPase